MTRVLPLRVAADPAPPPDRGRLLDADAVAAILNADAPGAPVSPAWVVRYVRPRVALSPRKLRWWESDVRAFLDTRREEVA